MGVAISLFQFSDALSSRCEMKLCLFKNPLTVSKNGSAAPGQHFHSGQCFPKSYRLIAAHMRTWRLLSMRMIGNASARAYSKTCVVEVAKELLVKRLRFVVMRTMALNAHAKSSGQAR